MEVAPTPEVILRKHAKQSLSQPTIPEEGPEHGEESECVIISSPFATGPATFSLSASVLRPKPELRVVKSLAQELTGAIRYGEDYHFVMFSVYAHPSIANHFSVSKFFFTIKDLYI